MRYRVQFETADGIRQYGRMEKLDREVWRPCMNILRLDGKERPMDITSPTQKRKYVLWTQKRNGTFVYREDNGGAGGE